jgi:hypothetical protein
MFQANTKETYKTSAHISMNQFKVIVLIMYKTSVNICKTTSLVEKCTNISPTKDIYTCKYSKLFSLKDASMTGPTGLVSSAFGS